jgi:hypothetical protein
MKSKIATLLRHVTAGQMKLAEPESKSLELGAAKFCDDFGSAVANLKVSKSGHQWNVLPANGSVRVLPVIEDGAMTAIDSGLELTAAYAAIDLGKSAKQVRATISFEPGRTGSGAALILTRTIRQTSDVGHIVQDGSVHVVFTPKKVLIGLFKNSDFFIAKVLRLPRTIRGSLNRRVVGYDIDGKILRVVVSGCHPVELKHNRVSELTGPYVTFETYWKSGQSRPKLHAVAAS